MRVSERVLISVDHEGRVSTGLFSQSLLGSFKKTGHLLYVIRIIMVSQPKRRYAD